VWKEMKKCSEKGASIKKGMQTKNPTLCNHENIENPKIAFHDPLHIKNNY
jgi:hypothetical protein